MPTTILKSWTLINHHDLWKGILHLSRFVYVIIPNNINFKINECSLFLMKLDFIPGNIWVSCFLEILEHPQLSVYYWRGSENPRTKRRMNNQRIQQRKCFLHAAWKWQMITFSPIHSIMVTQLCKIGIVFDYFRLKSHKQQVLIKETLDYKQQNGGSLYKSSYYLLFMRITRAQFWRHCI